MFRIHILTFILMALPGCDNGEPSGFAGNRSGTAEKDQNQSDRDEDLDTEDEKDEKNSKNKSSKNSDDDSDIDLSNGTTDDSDTDLTNGKSGDIETDDAEKVAKIPGVEVIRVGVNFEDLGFSSSSDKDYNDAVLCFSGNFKVEGTNVVSTKAQTVQGTTFSSSGCKHKVKVEIIHSDGSKEPQIEFDSRASSPVNMTFKLGSKMEVYMTPYDGCNPGVQRTMHESVHAQVAPGVCNNTGG